MSSDSDNSSLQAAAPKTHTFEAPATQVKAKKKFACTYEECGRLLSSNDALKMYISSKHTLRVFACICGKKFESQAEKTMHAFIEGHYNV